MEVIFITRTKAKNKEDLEKQKDLISLIQQVYLSDVKDIYIASNLGDSEIKLKGIPVKIIYDDDPIGPTSINTVLNKIKNKPTAFLICSKEVVLREDNIKTLIQEIENNETLLVAGYKFIIKDRKLNDELQDYYDSKDLIAFKVPWNTCAIWNYKLFTKNVDKFDEITSRNPFSPICVSIDGVCSETEHEGMEDGLAIAKAASRAGQDIKFKLKNKKLNWEIDIDENKVKKHRQKLARKDTVLRNFMAVRDYSVNDLENAVIK